MEEKAYYESTETVEIAVISQAISLKRIADALEVMAAPVIVGGKAEDLGQAPRPAKLP